MQALRNPCCGWQDLSRAIAYALRGMRNPVKRVFGVFCWGHTPTKTPHFLSSVVGYRPNAIALFERAVK